MGSLLHALFHGAAKGEGHLGRHDRLVALFAATAAPAASHTAFGFRFVGDRFPLRVFERFENHSVGLRGQGLLFAVDAQ